MHFHSWIHTEVKHLAQGCNGKDTSWESNLLTFGLQVQFPTTCYTTLPSLYSQILLRSHQLSTTVRTACSKYCHSEKTSPGSSSEFVTYLQYSHTDEPVDVSSEERAWLAESPPNSRVNKATVNMYFSPAWSDLIRDLGVVHSEPTAEGNL